MDELALIAILLVVGIFKDSLKEAIIISIFSTICSMLQALNLEQYLYSTIIIAIITISLKFLNSSLIRTAQIIWMIYFLLMFSFSAYDSLYQSTSAWSTVLYIHEWNKLFYLCTMLFVIAGLAKGGSGGHRANNNILHTDDSYLSIHR